jgi:uncharacterized membrane protein
MTGTAERVERVLSAVMLASVRVSTTALAAGLLLAFVRPDGHAAAWLLDVGILCLMATPLVRVLVAAAEGARARDRFLVLMIAVVAVLLALTLALAKRA